MAETELVNLDALNAKQRLKEFKATQKEVKSKDLVAKDAALKKLVDIRYLTEGGCFVPLVNSIVPKKVILLELLFKSCITNKPSLFFLLLHRKRWMYPNCVWITCSAFLMRKMLVTR